MIGLQIIIISSARMPGGAHRARQRQPRHERRRPSVLTVTFPHPRLCSRGVSKCSHEFRIILQPATGAAGWPAHEEARTMRHVTINYKRSALRLGCRMHIHARTPGGSPSSIAQRAPRHVDALTKRPTASIPLNSAVGAESVLSFFLLSSINRLYVCLLPHSSDWQTRLS